MYFFDIFLDIGFFLIGINSPSFLKFEDFGRDRPNEYQIENQLERDLVSLHNFELTCPLFEMNTIVEHQISGRQYRDMGDCSEGLDDR